MAKARTKFIKNAAKQLHDEWMVSSAATTLECFEKAIALGMDNAHLKDHDYTFTVKSYDNLWDFIIYRNGSRCIADSGYIFQSEEQAKHTAHAIIDILERD